MRQTPMRRYRKAFTAKLADNVLDVIKSFDKTLPGGFKNCKLLAINLVPGHGLPNVPFYESVLPRTKRIFEEHPIRPPDPWTLPFESFIEIWRSRDDR